MNNSIKLFLILLMFGFKEDEGEYYHVFKRDYSVVLSDLKVLTKEYLKNDKKEELDISFFFTVGNENKCEIYYIDFLDGDSAWGIDIMNYFRMLEIDLNMNPLLSKYSVDSFQIGVYAHHSFLYYDIRATDAADLEKENFIYEPCICPID